MQAYNSLVESFVVMETTEKRKSEPKVWMI